MKSYTNTILSLIVGAAIAVAAPSSEAQNIEQCVKKLGSCAENALKTVGQSLLTVGHLATNLALNGNCVAAIAAGDPTVIGVSAAVVGLGAGGLVNSSSAGACEADIYGVAVNPIGEILDSLLPSSNIVNRLQTEGLSQAKSIIGSIAIPVALAPPNVGSVLSCGCGALATGAQALEDIRKVAKFASAAAQSCGAAIDSCPGLKQLAAAGSAIASVITDPSSIVQDCDSMSRAQYTDARLMDMIPYVVDQFKSNTPWNGSNMQVNHWIPRLKTCYKYYDSHCYKEGPAENFCNGPVFSETFDPRVWAAIIEEFNGPQFDKFYAANVKKLIQPAACPSNVPGGGINIAANANNGGDPEKMAYAARAANQAACSAEMASLLSDGKEGQKGLKQLARDLLPNTREGWEDMRGAKDANIQSQKPMIGAEKIYLRAMTAASVVIKVQMAAASKEYMARDAQLFANADFATVSLQVLNAKFSTWAGFAILGYTQKCPADTKGWAGKFDMQCTQEFWRSVGFEAQAASSLKASNEFPAMSFPEQGKVGNFKGSTYYTKALQMMTAPRNSPPVRIPGSAPNLEKETEFYQQRWPAASDAITAMLTADMPSFFAKHHERVAVLKIKREQQEKTFAAIQSDGESMSKLALEACDKIANVVLTGVTGGAAGSAPQIGANKSIAGASEVQCKTDVNTLARGQGVALLGFKNKAFAGLASNNEPGSDANVSKATADSNALIASNQQKIEQLLKSHGAQALYTQNQARAQSKPPAPAGALSGAGLGGLIASSQGASSGAGGALPRANNVVPAGAVSSVIASAPVIPTTPATAPRSDVNVGSRAAGLPPTPGMQPLIVSNSPPRTGAVVGLPGTPGMQAAPPKGLTAAVPPAATPPAPQIVAATTPASNSAKDFVAVITPDKAPPSAVPPPSAAGNNAAPTAVLAPTPPPVVVVVVPPAPLPPPFNFDDASYRSSRQGELIKLWTDRCKDKTQCINTVRLGVNAWIQAEIDELEKAKSIVMVVAITPKVQSDQAAKFEPQLNEVIKNAFVVAQPSPPTGSTSPVKNMPKQLKL